MSVRRPGEVKPALAEAAFILWIVAVTLLYYRQWLPRLGELLRHLGAVIR